MRQSQLFTKTRRDAPKGESAKNAILLIRGGFVHKEMAGAYSYLPLGLRVLKKIEHIIREEMNTAGAMEVFLTALQDPNIWKKTGRWDDKVVDNWFKSTLKSGAEIGFAHTHEEPLTSMLTQFVDSHKDLPFSAYQFQTKFRNELRAKSGIMRGREFVMKDLYSFCRNKEEHDTVYHIMKDAYTRIFDRVGIGKYTYFTYASGGTFSESSDEFQAITDAGEDIIHICDTCKEAINEEMYGKGMHACRLCGNKNLRKEKSVEVGNIFPLGTKFSEMFGLTFKDESGANVPVVMGSYGIGLGRLMGTVVEVLSDEKGIVWPASIAPFDVHLVALDGEDADTRAGAEHLYATLSEAGIAVLYDDRLVRAGEKFADAELIGIPKRYVVSKRTIAEGIVEEKMRTEETVKKVPLAHIRTPH